MSQMSLSYTAESSLRCQKNKSVDVFFKSHARKCTIWFMEKRRTGMEKEALLNYTLLLPGHRCLKTMCPCLKGITIKRHLRKMKTKVDFLAQTLHLIGEESSPNPLHIGYLLIKHQR